MEIGKSQALLLTVAVTLPTQAAIKVLEAGAKGQIILTCLQVNNSANRLIAGCGGTLGSPTHIALTCSSWVGLEPDLSSPCAPPQECDGLAKAVTIPVPMSFALFKGKDRNDEEAKQAAADREARLQQYHGTGSGDALVYVLPLSPGATDPNKCMSALFKEHMKAFTAAAGGRMLGNGRQLALLGPDLNGDKSWHSLPARLSTPPPCMQPVAAPQDSKPDSLHPTHHASGEAHAQLTRTDTGAYPNHPMPSPDNHKDYKRCFINGLTTIMSTSGGFLFNVHFTPVKGPAHPTVTSYYKEHNIAPEIWDKAFIAHFACPHGARALDRAGLLQYACGCHSFALLNLRQYPTGSTVPTAVLQRAVESGIYISLGSTTSLSQLQELVELVSTQLGYVQTFAENTLLLGGTKGKLVLDYLKRQWQDPDSDPSHPAGRPRVLDADGQASPTSRLSLAHVFITSPTGQIRHLSEMQPTRYADAQYGTDPTFDTPAGTMLLIMEDKFSAALCLSSLSDGAMIVRPRHYFVKQQGEMRQLSLPQGSPLAPAEGTMLTPSGTGPASDFRAFHWLMKAAAGNTKPDLSSMDSLTEKGYVQMACRNITALFSQPAAAIIPLPPQFASPSPQGKQINRFLSGVVAVDDDWGEEEGEPACALLGALMAAAAEEVPPGQGSQVCALACKAGRNATHDQPLTAPDAWAGTMTLLPTKRHPPTVCTRTDNAWYRPPTSMNTTCWVLGLTPPCSPSSGRRTRSRSRAAGAGATGTSRAGATATGTRVTGASSAPAWTRRRKVIGERSPCNTLQSAAHLLQSMQSGDLIQEASASRIARLDMYATASYAQAATWPNLYPPPCAICERPQTYAWGQTWSARQCGGCWSSPALRRHRTDGCNGMSNVSIVAHCVAALRAALAATSVAWLLYDGRVLSIGWLLWRWLMWQYAGWVISVLQLGMGAVRHSWNTQRLQCTGHMRSFASCGVTRVLIWGLRGCPKVAGTYPCNGRGLWDTSSCCRTRLWGIVDGGCQSMGSCRWHRVPRVCVPWHCPSRLCADMAGW